MPSKGKLVVIAAVSALTTVTLLASVQANAAGHHGWASGLPGCHPGAPAVAHHAGQRVLSPQPGNGPVPCGTSTGFPAIENRIEVTNSNAVIYDVALIGGPVDAGDGHTPGWGRNETLARSYDNGGRWDTVSVPVWPDTLALDGQTDDNIYVDHETGRLFFYMQNSGPIGVGTYCGGTFDATVAFSDNDGTSWTWAFDHDHSCAENPTVLTGRPTPSGGQPTSYKNVVYLCGDNTSSGTATVGTPGYSCSKSLTGGASWLGTTLQGASLDGAIHPGQGFYSGNAKDVLDPYPQCAGQSSSAGADVQPLPNGTLVVVVSCNSKTYLSESADEGSHWKIVHQIPYAVSASGAPGGSNLRIDSAGNMYLLHQTTATATASAELLLTHSTDGGATWSPQLNMSAPGVTSVGTYEFAQGTYMAGKVGDVAVAYYGNLRGHTTSDGFITETRDALDRNPVFWSGQVNDPAHPLLYNTSTDGNIGLTVLDIMGGAFSPDGRSVWGSFVQDCGANVATDSNCQNRLPTTNPTNPDDGFAGRLVWPPPEQS